MPGRTKQGFVLSILLHVAVVTGAFLLTLIRPPEKKAPELFELVAPPPAGPAEPSPAPPIDFSAPEEPIPIPQVQPPPPRPEPPPPRPPDPPKPKPPEPVRPKPPEPPKPKPPEPAPEPPRQMSLEEFRRQNPQRPRQQTTQAPPRRVNVPRVDTKFTVNLRDTMVNVDTLTGLSQIQQSELQSYIARLREALRMSWAKPAGLAQTLATEVEFRVAPAGTLTAVRVTRGSGNAQFDDSVQQAFRSLGTGGPTPESKPLHLRLTFRMNE